MSGRYRMTVVSPLLAGGGEQLTPLDYLVWQNEVRVLDQERIFKVLARNPRLENYLTQLRRGERLEWSQWGGYAQSYAAASIPFASGGLAGVWEKARIDDLDIPLFARGGGRRILPGSAFKGAFKTAWLGGAVDASKAEAVWREAAGGENSRWTNSTVLELAAGRGVLTGLGFSDGRIPNDSFRIYQTRILVLRKDGKAGPAEWKPGQRFAEMARPGTVIEGRYDPPSGFAQVLESVNRQVRRWVTQHDEFARKSALKPLIEAVSRLESQAGNGECLLPIGWGSGFAAKTFLPDSASEGARKLLFDLADVRNSMVEGLPFPKTRRIVLDGAGGAYLCGWVKIAFE